MKFTVECQESKDLGRFYRFNFKEPLREDCGLLIVDSRDLEEASGRDGPYLFHFGPDLMKVTVLRYYEHIVPGYEGEKKADGVYYDNFLKVHRKTLRDRLPKMKVGEKITITTWDELYNQNEIKHDLLEIRKFLNHEIQKRQSYGLRTFTTTKPGYALLWSNAQARWLRQARFVLEGEELRLDANEIFAPYTQAEIDAVIEDLSALPLYAYSFEAKAGMIGRTKEQLGEYLEKLEKEFEVAKLEEDELKQRNITFTIRYIKHLLAENGEHIEEEHIRG